MKNQFVTIILAVALGLVLTLLGKIAYTNYQLKSRTTDLNTELMQSDLELGRALTKFGIAQDQISKLSKDVQLEIEARGSLITRYGELEARYNVLVEKQSVTEVNTVYVDTPVECSVAKFRQGMLYQAITDHSLLTLKEYTGRITDFRLDVDCTILPTPNNEGLIPMSIAYQLHQRFGGQFIETHLPSGGINHYIRLFELDADGKEVGDLELTSWSVTVLDQTAPKFYWWAPHIDLAIFAGANSMDLKLSTSFGLSLAGYGVTKNDLSWKFLRFSGDFGEDVGLGLSPLLYNLGEILPLVSNLWIGPHVSKGLNSSWTLGLIIGAQL